MRRRTLAAALALLPFLFPWADASAQDCAHHGLALQVLGSGGPDLAAGRGQGSALLWVNGHARVLIDAGGGAAPRLAAAGARLADLDAILLTRLTADRVSDLPALLEAAVLAGRLEPLPLFGPAGSPQMPSTVTFARTLFDKSRGAYRYLGDLLSPLDRGSLKLRPQDLLFRGETIRRAFVNERLLVTAATLPHPTTPTLAFRIDTGGHGVVVSGGSGGQGDTLERLARGADLLVIPQAGPAEVSGPVREPPHPAEAIAGLAARAKVRQLVLTRHTAATLGHEEDGLAAIRRGYEGPVQLSEDGACYPLTGGN